MLNDIMPRYEFNEVHQRCVTATVEATWAALVTLTLDDLIITRPLIALRHLTRASTPRGPLLTDGPVTLLHREEGRVAIAGAISRPWQLRAPKRPITDLTGFMAFDEPGWTKYLTEFRIEPEQGDDRCIVSTETRGLSTDGFARRRFRLYWTLIRTPSGLIRREMLRAIARSAVSIERGQTSREQT